MVSVIIPNHNRKDLVTKAVNSALCQTYRDIEVIVVDDASTDNSIECLSIIDDSRLKVIALPFNQGACVARNIGIKNARGDYIAFLDSDDQWVDEKLNETLLLMSQTACDVVCSSYTYFSENGESEVRPKYKITNTESMMSQLLKKNFITTGTVLAKRECFNDVCFDENLPRYQDWDLALQLAQKYEIAFLNEPLLNMYEQKNSITKSTSMEKKYKALEHIYHKYQDAFQREPEGKAQILWSAGMYSLFAESPRYDYLKEGVFGGKIDIKRLLLYILIKIGAEDFVRNMYAKEH